MTSEPSTDERNKAALDALRGLVEDLLPDLLPFLDTTEDPEEALRRSADLLGELRALRVFWKYGSDLVFGGCNYLVAADAGLQGPEEIVGAQDYDMPWRLQASKYRNDDLKVFFSGEPRIGILERQSNSGGFIYLRTSKAPVLHEGAAIGILGLFEILSQEQYERLNRQALHAKSA